MSKKWNNLLLIVILFSVYFYYKWKRQNLVGEGVLSLTQSYNYFLRHVPLQKLYYKLAHWQEILIVTKTWRTTTRREDEESYGDYRREQLKLWFTHLGPHKSKRCHWQLQSCDLRKTATKLLHSSYCTFYVGWLCSDFLSIFTQLSRLIDHVL